MRRRAKIWQVREDYRPLLHQAKELFPTLLRHVVTKRIFLCSFLSRRSAHIARIHRNAPPWALISSSYDYAIEFWSTRFDREAEAYKMFVVVHELLHIPPQGFDKHSQDYRRLLKHDLEDFLWLRQVYGIQLEKHQDVLKGEKNLIVQKGPRRFPRLLKVR